MARRSRRNPGLSFWAKVAVAAIRGEKALIGLAQEFDVHPNQIKQWRDQRLEGATGVFGEASTAEPEPSIEVKALHAKIGEPRRENDPAQDLRGPAGVRFVPRYPARSARLVCGRAVEREPVNATG